MELDLECIDSQIYSKEGILFKDEKRLKLNSPEWDSIVSLFWDQINSNLQNDCNENNLKYHFLDALKYNLFINYDMSERIFLNALSNCNNDFRLFICHAFIWSTSSKKDKSINFLFWFENLFQRPPILEYFELLSKQCFYITLTDLDFLGLTYIISLNPNRSNPIDYFNNFEFQKIILDFEIAVDERMVYMIDELLFLRKKRFISVSDIESLTPLKYRNKLEELGAWESYIIEILAACKIRLLPNNQSPYDYYKEFVAKDFINFASFVYASFYWSWSKKKFSWWYKTVFGFNFEHEEGYGLTSMQIQENIKNYNEDDGYSRNDYSESDTYTSRDSFLDAYSDGFSRNEDDFYYGGDD